MLHYPPAQRGAAHPRRSLRPRTPRSQPLLSVTLGDMPGDRVIACDEIAPGHWLVTVRRGACYGRIAYDYAYSSAIPRWVGERVYAVHGVVNPAKDMSAYRLSCWWHEEWLMGIAAVLAAEQMSVDQGDGLLTPWRHDWMTPGAAPARAS